MPFDAIAPLGFAPAEETIALYRERRERAIEAVAGTLSWRRRLDLCIFKLGGLFTTRACFLGWLAEIGHDGWHWEGPEPLRGGDNPFQDAEDYFGIDNATRMFSPHWLGPALGEPLRPTTIHDVADALRRARVVIPGRHRDPAWKWTGQPAGAG